MIRYLIPFSLASLGCGGAQPEPLLVVLEQDPWKMVIGSDSPTFALYDDGTAIFLQTEPTFDVPYLSRKIVDPAANVHALLSFDPAKMDSRYEISALTDQVTTLVWTPEKNIVIYGNWRKPFDLGVDSEPSVMAIIESEKQMWESLPLEIRQALMRIDQERSPSGDPWLPPKIEVMFWPYEYAPDESIAWPEDWPGLTAKNTRKRGDSFSVFLPSEEFSDLRRFLATRKERGAVLIDGKKMAVATRFPFPGEDAWMR